MPDAPHPRARRLHQLGWLIAIAVAYLYVFPYFPRIHSANELPRAYLVKAIVEDHTFAIDKQVAHWGGTADVSPSGGHQYSNKAPGSSLLAVPFYWVASKITGGSPSIAVTLWICRVFAGVIPALLFLWLLWGFLERYAPNPHVRQLVLIGYGLGSMAMTFSLLFYSHQLSAVCIGSAWILALDVVDGRRGNVWMTAVGFLAGAAVLCDYQAAFAGVPLLVYFVVRCWSRPGELIVSIAIAAVAAAIPIAILLAYHKACFGGALRTGYDASTTFAQFHKQGFLGISKLRSEAFWGSFVKPDNGLLVLSPWVLLAIPGGIYMWRRGERGHVLAVLAVVVIYVLFQCSIAMWRAGWGVGPRYITVMLPFLLPLVATALEKWRTQDLLFGAAAGTIVSAVVIYGLTSATFPYWPDSLKNPLFEVTFRLLSDNAVGPNLGSALGIGGLVGLIPYFVAVFGALAYALYRAGGLTAVGIAAAVALAIFVGFRLAPFTGPHAQAAYVNTVYPAVTK